MRNISLCSGKGLKLGMNGKPTTPKSDPISVLPMAKGLPFEVPNSVE
jgi:hypothetical protein